MAGTGYSWLIYVSLTIVAWGLYGVFLHNGQLGMADPENGRYKAFLFVGIAYFLTAVVAPIVVVADAWGQLELPREWRLVVSGGRNRRRHRCFLCPVGLWCRRYAERGDGTGLCRRAAWSTRSWR